MQDPSDAADVLCDKLESLTDVPKIGVQKRLEVFENWGFNDYDAVMATKASFYAEKNVKRSGISFVVTNDEKHSATNSRTADNHIGVDDDGVIWVTDNTGVEQVGSISNLFSLPPYHNGVIETHNGLCIPIREFIGTMSVSQTTTFNMMNASEEPKHPEHVLTERMHYFHGALFNQLRGNLTTGNK